MKVLVSGDGSVSAVGADAGQSGRAGGPIGGDDEVALINAEEARGVGEEGDFEASDKWVIAPDTDVAGHGRDGTGWLAYGAAFTGGERAVERAEAGEPDVDRRAGGRGIVLGDEGGEILLGGLRCAVYISGLDEGAGWDLNAMRSLTAKGVSGEDRENILPAFISKSQEIWPS